MAKDAAIVITWGTSVRGREAKSLEVFMDALTYWGKQAAEGRCSAPEAFLAEDANGGMLVVKGRSDVLRELTESDEGRMITTKAQLIVNDLHVRLFYTGDDEIQRETQRFLQAGTELGYI